MPEKMKAIPKAMKPQSTIELMCTAIASEGLVAGRKARSTQGSRTSISSTGMPVNTRAKSAPLSAICSTRSILPAPTFWAAIDDTEAPSAMAGICT